MSAHPPGSGVAARRAPAQPKTRGFLHIDRHGAGPQAIYVVTYHRVNQGGTRPRPIEAVGAEARLGSANIPDLWLTDEEILEKGLVES